MRGFGVRKKINGTDRDMSIVCERRIMKSFVAIEFKQKWIMIMPFCSPTHLASD
jgi:hypothetical protein